MTAGYNGAVWARNRMATLEKRDGRGSGAHGDYDAICRLRHGNCSVGKAAAATTFTFRNNCPHIVWPGTLSGNAASALAGSGFELRPNGTLSFWARTGCAFDPFSASGTCDTGDCGGALRCTVGGSPPVTLAEFTLAGPTSGDQDFYDVSLVDGYNVGVAVRPSSAAAGGGRGGGGNCRYTGCAADVNAQCPAEWRVTGASGETVACRSACEAFRAAEYCCTGTHSSPASCGPSRYSQLFKAACPAAYSYAYDDVTSTFTCAAGTAGYIVTFCPSSADAKS
ncbi:hypothetical protein OPV22_033593 [Ensete ventricosum]|uniref:Thaumatin-like protein n=1 Tax=Ensete ventricosum TaxID=4639 RepID=A0AAV8PQE6_ENSVE|nr:hypothetical protein OPV22_033593 [Ensete ventricosum]